MQYDNVEKKNVKKIIALEALIEQRLDKRLEITSVTTGKHNTVMHNDTLAYHHYKFLYV